MTHSFPTRRSSDLAAEGLDFVCDSLRAVDVKIVHYDAGPSLRKEQRRRASDTLPSAGHQGDLASQVHQAIHIFPRVWNWESVRKIGRASCRERVCQYV